MKTKGFIQLCVFIIFMISGEITAAVADEGMDLVSIMEAPSYVPKEEAYIHIAGGFFSVFDGQKGKVFSAAYTADELAVKRQNELNMDRQTCGSVKMKLSRLEYCSRFVYRPEGALSVEIAGETQNFAMVKLDYVAFSDSKEPFYRLSGTSGSAEAGRNSEAGLICYVENSSRPILYGILCIRYESGAVSCYPVRICGRGENEAEKHLSKVITSLSCFTF